MTDLEIACAAKNTANVRHKELLRLFQRALDQIVSPLGLPQGLNCSVGFIHVWKEVLERKEKKSDLN